MTGNDVPDVDMPNISQPQRQDEPAVTDADLAALLAGTPDAVPGLRPVADVLAALTAEASGAELAGEARVLAEFRRRIRVPVSSQQTHRIAGLTSRLGFKVGASAAAVAVLLGGGAAAAFADALPAPIQRLAHEAIGAPIPPRHTLPHRARPAAHGQHVAHGQHAAHGKPAARGGPAAKRQARPHPTPNPTAQGNTHGQGKQGKGEHGQQGQGNGQGNEGNGQGQGHAPGHQGNSQKHGNGQAQRGAGQGNGQAQRGAGQGNGPHAPAWHGKPHNGGPRGNSQLSQRPAGHPRRSGHPGQL